MTTKLVVQTLALAFTGVVALVLCVAFALPLFRRRPPDDVTTHRR